MNFLVIGQPRGLVIAPVPGFPDPTVNLPEMTNILPGTPAAALRCLIRLCGGCLNGRLLGGQILGHRFLADRSLGDRLFVDRFLGDRFLGGRRYRGR